MALENPWCKMPCLKVLATLARKNNEYKPILKYWTVHAKYIDALRKKMHRQLRLNYYLNPGGPKITNARYRKYEEEWNLLHYEIDYIRRLLSNRKCPFTLDCKHMKKQGFCSNKIYEKCPGAKLYEIEKLTDIDIAAALHVIVGSKDMAPSEIAVVRRAIEHKQSEKE